MEKVKFDSVGDRISYIADRLKISLRELAATSRLNYFLLESLSNESHPDAIEEVINAICWKFPVNEDWLTLNVGQPFTVSDTRLDDYIAGLTKMPMDLEFEIEDRD